MKNTRNRAYWRSVYRHKKYVFQEMRKMGFSLWQCLIHDWDKYLPWMWKNYAFCFYNLDGSNRYMEGEAFDHAWNGHQKRNKHHWQYYVLIMDRGDIVPLRMPERHMKEMLADWRGAGRAYGKIGTNDPDTKGWYLKRREIFMKYFHPDTLAWFDRQLGISE